MAMYKSLFDLSIEETTSTEMPHTVKFSNETGTGSMIICPLFLGAELYYNDMHLAFFEEATAPMRNVIEINHCRVGRYECSFGANSCCYLAAGDFAVCAAARKKSSSCFPLRHYHGITILLDLDAISPEMRKQMEWYGVDLDVIRRYICTENRCCILRSEPTIAHIFSELYFVPQQIKGDYYKVKALELLLYLDALQFSDSKEDRPYFYKGQVEKIKAIHDLITANLQEHYTMDELAERFQISLTGMKTCFKEIYGDSMYSYLRRYRMNVAATMLRQDSKKGIAEIAGAVGYESPSKFATAFRQVIGQTPMEYRKSFF